MQHWHNCESCLVEWQCLTGLKILVPQRVYINIVIFQWQYCQYFHWYINTELIDLHLLYEVKQEICSHPMHFHELSIILENYCLLCHIFFLLLNKLRDILPCLYITWYRKTTVQCSDIWQNPLQTLIHFNTLNKANQCMKCISVCFTCHQCNDASL